MRRTTFRRRRPKEGPSLIYFELGDDLYAIDMKWIHRVDPNINIVRIPCVPTFILGLTSIGDEIITVVDLHEFLEVSRDYTPKSQIILAIGEQRLAFLSDTVPGFITLRNPIKAPPGREEDLSILLGVSEYGDEVVHIIDAEQLYWILTGNFERIQSRIFRGFHKRLSESLSPDPWQNQGPGQAPPLFPGSALPESAAPIRVVHLDALFTTALALLEELDRRHGVSLSQWTAADVKSKIEDCLLSPIPTEALKNSFDMLDAEAFETLKKHVFERHIESSEASS